MDSRLHACLDGDLPRSQLTVEELLQLEEMERALGRVTESLERATVPDLSARIMANLPESEPVPTSAERISAAVRNGFAWLWSPRTLVVRPRPIYGFAGALALMLLVWNTPTADTGLTAPPIAAEQVEQPAMFVQFRLDLTDAARVQLAGSFTEWMPDHDLQETAPGVWTALIRLQPGVHEYLFVVDGTEWVADPVAPSTPDSFGGVNSRLLLSTPTAET